MLSTQSIRKILVFSLVIRQLLVFLSIKKLLWEEGVYMSCMKWLVATNEKAISRWISG